MNKLRLRPVAALVILAAAFALPLNLRAQAPEGPDTTSSTTEDSTGKVTGIAPGQTITVDSRRGPFTYRLGRDLHVVGPDGKAEKVDEVRVGQEVTVYYYMRDGEDRPWPGSPFSRRTEKRISNRTDRSPTRHRGGKLFAPRARRILARGFCLSGGKSPKRYIS